MLKVMRRTLNRLISWMGLFIALVLVVAGGLLWWANSFISDQVSAQLSMQNITMPAEDQLETDAQKQALGKYAGEPMTTGDQPKAYADQEKVAELGQLRQTLFMGNTLRGLLLNAYAFATMGTIAMYAAYAAFGGAIVLFVLGLLGLRHAAKVSSAAVASHKEPALV